MIRKKDEINREDHANKFGGAGYITVRSLLTGEEEMYGKGRCFAHTTVHPGSEIGYHMHHGESETYYFLSGMAEFNDNGVIRQVGPGDVTFTGDGEGHGVKNIGSEPVEVIALILYH